MSLEYPCVYWNNGKCKKFSEDDIVSWCVNGPCEDMRPSNADRIRAMSDEELVVLIRCGICADIGNEERCNFGDCLDCIREWLKQPAEVEG